jgi:hypothetical protein
MRYSVNWERFCECALIKSSCPCYMDTYSGLERCNRWKQLCDFFFENKERKNHRKCKETQDHFLRCTAGRSQKRIRVRHGARSYAFVRTWRADWDYLYERKLYVLHTHGYVRSKTRSLRCRSSILVCVCRALEFVLLQHEPSKAQW